MTIIINVQTQQCAANLKTRTNIQVNTQTHRYDTNKQTKQKTITGRIGTSTDPKFN